MADSSLGRAILRTELDRSGLEAGLRQARTSATTALGQVERQATNSSRRIGSALTNAFRPLTQISLGSILGTGGALYALQSMAREAFNTQTGMRLLDRQLERNNITFFEGRNAVNAIAEELHVLPSAISDNVAQLLRAGLSMDEISAAFRGGAASALAFGKDASTGIETVTAAIVTGRSTLLDSIGISQNLDLAYRSLADTLGTTVDKLTQTQRAQAAVQLVTQYTKEEVEDLPVMFSGLGGAASDLNTNFQRLRIEIGEELLPTFTAVIGAVSSAVGWIADLPEPVLAAGAAAATAATGVTALAIAFGALKVALGGLTGSAGLLLAIVAGIGGVVGAIISLGRETEDYEETARTAFGRIEQANTMPEIRDAAVQLRDEISSSEQRQAWDDFIAKIDEGKSSAEELKNELIALSQTAVTAPLIAQLSMLEAELASLNQNERIATEFQEPQRLVDDLNDRIMRFGGGTSGLVAQWNKDLGVFLTLNGRIVDTLEVLTEASSNVFDLTEAGLNPQELESIWNMAQSFSRTAQQGMDDTSQRARELRQEIAEVQARIDAVNNIVATGSATPGGDEPPPPGGPGDPADEILPPGSIAELEQRIAKLKEEIKLTPDDDTRWELTVELQGLESELRRMENAIRPRQLEIEVVVNNDDLNDFLDRRLARTESEARRRLRSIFADPRANEGPTPRTFDTPFERREAMQDARDRQQQRERRQLDAEWDRLRRLAVRRNQEQRERFGASEAVGDTGDWREAWRVVSDVREQLELVDSRAQLFGETGQELATKQQLLQRAAERLISMGLDPEHVLVRMLIQDYEDFGAAIRQSEQDQRDAEREASRRTRERARAQEALDPSDRGAGAFRSSAEQAAWVRQQRELREEERRAAEAQAAAARARSQTLRGLDNEVTGATTGWTEYREVLSDLRDELSFIDAEAELFGDSQSRLEARTAALRNAITTLLRMGFHPQSAALRELVEQYNLTSDAADINADTLLAQEEAAKRAAEAQVELADATQDAEAALGRAPSSLDLLIDRLEELRDSGELTEEQLAEVVKLLEELEGLKANNELADQFEDISDKVMTVVGALDTLLNTDWSNGNEALEGLTSAAGDLVSLIPGLGPAVGGLIKNIGAAISSLLGDLRNGLEEVRQETKDIQDDFELIDISSLIKTKQVSRGGLLGLFGLTYTAVDQEASEVGLSIAQSLEEGVLSGLRNGLDRFLETGKIEDLEFALQEGIYQGVTDALLSAIVEQGVIQGILGPSLLELSEAIAQGYETGDYSNATRILQDIQAMVPEIAGELAPIFSMFKDLKPVEPNGEGGPGAPGGGRQISELTGPTRDLLTDLLTPLAALVSVPQLLQEQLRVQENMLIALTGGRPILETPIGIPLHPQPAPGDDGGRGRFGRAGDGGILVEGDLILNTPAKSGRELYREISSQHAKASRGRRA